MTVDLSKNWEALVKAMTDEQYTEFLEALWDMKHKLESELELESYITHIDQDDATGYNIVGEYAYTQKGEFVAQQLERVEQLLTIA